MTKEKPSSYRLTTEAKRLLKEIAKYHLRSETNTIEFLIKQEANVLKIK